MIVSRLLGSWCWTANSGAVRCAPFAMITTSCWYEPPTNCCGFLHSPRLPLRCWELCVYHDTFIWPGWYWSNALVCLFQAGLFPNNLAESGAVLQALLQAQNSPAELPLPKATPAAADTGPPAGSPSTLVASQDAMQPAQAAPREVLNVNLGGAPGAGMCTPTMTDICNIAQFWLIDIFRSRHNLCSAKGPGVCAIPPHLFHQEHPLSGGGLAVRLPQMHASDAATATCPQQAT